MKYLIIISLAFLAGITGCADTPVSKIEVQKVEVPINVPCKTEEPPAPNYNTPNIKATDDIYVKIRTLLADAQLHAAYDIELLAALRSCK